MAFEINSEDNSYFTRKIYFDYPELIKLKSKIDSCVSDNHSLNILQKFTSDESGVVWDASIFVAKYLEKYFHDNAHIDPSMLNIVELGSGTGFLGLWMAAMGSSVLLTDLENNLELIKKNFEINTLFYDDNLVDIKCFDWLNQSEYQWNHFLKWKCFDQIDYILISDCLYYEEVGYAFFFS